MGLPEILQALEHLIFLLIIVFQGIVIHLIGVRKALIQVFSGVNKHLEVVLLIL
jgi:hypothetical protein